MEKIKHDIIAWWLKRIFFRRLGKRYPEFFAKLVNENTDSRLCRRIMKMRYIGDENGDQMAFETIAYTIHVSPRRVFEVHKKFIDDFINR